MHRRLHLISLAASLGLLAFSAQAQTASYPTHPVKVVVALPAGGGVDMIARLVGQQLQAGTGQPFIVDNRAGASGRIGLPAVAKASPDGYTLMASPASFLTTNKSIFKDLPYDPQADFAPITKLANQAMVLVVRDRKKFPNAAAVLAAAKAQPTVVTYASSGEGSPQHLAALMFETRGQLQMTHVPYKGGALAINDMLGGNVDLLFAPLPEPQIGQAHGAGADERQALAVDCRGADDGGGRHSRHGDADLDRPAGPGAHAAPDCRCAQPPGAGHFAAR
jgi:tripartite-type tricarboxylate transporter receptor subunit TctC